MHEIHPFLETPPDDTILWRYMDLTKLVALIGTKSIFFARADKLGDPWEGALPEKNRWSRDEDIKQGKFKSSLEDAVLKALPKFFEAMLQKTLISCWHEGHHESAAMWKMYLKSDEGIAVRTTAGRLKSSLDTCTRPIFLSRVRYIDYESGLFERGTLTPFVHKRLSFSHEAEVRAVIQLEQEDVEDGLAVPVDVENLIQDVYVAPRTPDWTLEAVASILEKFGLDRSVIRSALDKKPLY